MGPKLNFSNWFFAIRKSIASVRKTAIPEYFCSRFFSISTHGHPHARPEALIKLAVQPTLAIRLWSNDPILLICFLLCVCVGHVDFRAVGQWGLGLDVNSE